MARHVEHDPIQIRTATRDPNELTWADCLHREKGPDARRRQLSRLPLGAATAVPVVTAIRSHTNVVSVEPGDNRGERLARAYEEIALLSNDRDVIGVSVTPISTRHDGYRRDHSTTLAVLVTLVWPEPGS